MRRWLETLAQDLGYAIRSFRRSPAFVLVALLSLTLGIGATTAIFSVVNGVLIKSLPFPDSERLIALTHRLDLDDAVAFLGTVDHEGLKGAL